MEKEEKKIKKSTDGGEKGFRTHKFRTVRKLALVQKLAPVLIFAPWCEFSCYVLPFLFCSCSAPLLLICRASSGSDSLCLVDSTNLALKSYKKSQNAIIIIAGTLMCKSG